MHQLSLLRRIGLNNDGCIGFKEFKKFIKSTRKAITAREAKEAARRKAAKGGATTNTERFLAMQEQQQEEARKEREALSLISRGETGGPRSRPNSSTAVATTTSSAMPGSSLADIRSQARLESADGPKPRTNRLLASKTVPGTLLVLALALALALALTLTLAVALALALVLALVLALPSKLLALLL